MVANDVLSLSLLISILQAWERTINGTDVLDNMELVNVPKYTKDYTNYPRHQLFKNNEALIADFHRRCWQDVARPLFVLFALALELPENYFVDRHAYDLPSQDHLRYVSEYGFARRISSDVPSR